LIHHARQQVLIEAAPVHADAYRLLVAACDFDHLRELRIAFAASADVARIDPVFRERFGTSGMSLEQTMAVEVEIAYERRRHALLRQAIANLRHGERSLLGVHRDAHE